MVNYERSCPAPSTLSIERSKNSGTYSAPDVLHALTDIFYHKCYICEQKGPTSINVEHFKPHKNDIDLKFSWENLFLACGHCNNTKLAKPKYDDILNCMDKAHRVDEWLRCELNALEEVAIKVTPVLGQANVLNTANLLEEVYNGTTTAKKIEASYIRKNIFKEIFDFQMSIMEYLSDSASEYERGLHLRNIQSHLKIESQFCSFKRWIVRDNPKLFSKFSHLLV